jgi:hypothetical protein
MDNSWNNFLFTVKKSSEQHGQEFALSNPLYVIDCHASYGLCFENDNDIYAANDYNTNTNSYTNLGTTYVNNTGIADHQIFNDEQYFIVQEIEVFSITV